MNLKPYVCVAALAFLASCGQGASTYNPAAPASLNNPGFVPAAKYHGPTFSIAIELPDALHPNNGANVRKSQSNDVRREEEIRLRGGRLLPSYLQRRKDLRLRNSFFRLEGVEDQKLYVFRLREVSTPKAAFWHRATSREPSARAPSFS